MRIERTHGVGWVRRRFFWGDKVFFDYLDHLNLFKVVLFGHVVYSKVKPCKT
jgi:hypothetical protein